MSMNICHVCKNEILNNEIFVHLFYLAVRCKKCNIRFDYTKSNNIIQDIFSDNLRLKVDLIKFNDKKKECVLYLNSNEIYSEILNENTYNNEYIIRLFIKNYENLIFI